MPTARVPAMASSIRMWEVRSRRYAAKVEVPGSWIEISVGVLAMKGYNCPGSYIFVPETE